MDFDYYKKFNNDLKHFTNKELSLHYDKYGVNENRIINQKTFLEKYPNFDANEYREMYYDLKDFSTIELELHYHFYGFNENRRAFKNIKNIVIVFIAHNNESIERNLNHLNNKVCYCIVVGNNQIKEDYVNHPKIFIARSYNNNIEIENKLLTFTAWYLIIKNNLFSIADYICILEYDVTIEPKFIHQLTLECQYGNDVYSFEKTQGCFTVHITFEVLYEFFKLKGVDISNINFEIIWNSSTNHCIKKEILKDFVNWYYPDCLYIKKMDLFWLSFYHERVFAAYLLVWKKNIVYLSNILYHNLLRSHNLY